MLLQVIGKSSFFFKYYNYKIFYCSRRLIKQQFYPHWLMFPSETSQNSWFNQYFWAHRTPSYVLSCVPYFVSVTVSFHIFKEVLIFIYQEVPTTLRLSLLWNDVNIYITWYSFLRIHQTDFCSYNTTVLNASVVFNLILCIFNCPFLI